MVVQFDNQQYIKEADSFSDFLLFLKKTNDFFKLFFGIVGVIIVSLALFPFVLITLFIVTRITGKMLKESRKIKIELKQTILSEETKYSDLIKVEEGIKRVLKKLESVAYLKSDKSPKIFVRLFDNINLFNKEMLEMDEIIKSSYLYNKEELGLSESDLKEYSAQFKGLSDIWDYESSLEEKETVFNHKKQLHA